VCRGPGKAEVGARRPPSEGRNKEEGRLKPFLEVEAIELVDWLLLQ
jgi:hypothetical protein